MSRTNAFHNYVEALVDGGIKPSKLNSSTPPLHSPPVPVVVHLDNVALTSPTDQVGDTRLFKFYFIELATVHRSHHSRRSHRTRMQRAMEIRFESNKRLQ